MACSIPATVTQPAVSEPLLHSINNTGKPTTKLAALVPICHYGAVFMQLLATHIILASYIPQEY
jgi:hypothetical protein